MSINVIWQQATQYPAAVDRTLINAAMYPDSDTTARDGVLTIGSLEPTFDTGMTVSVAAGQAVVSGYLVTVDPAESVTLNVGGAQQRNDLIVLRVYDQQEADGDTKGEVEVVQGDPGGAIPPLPARSLLLATVHVAATQSTLTQGDITDERQWTTGRGGVLYLPGALGSNPPGWMDDGQAVFDDGKIAVKDGNAWHISRRESDTISLPSEVSGTLSVARGGTGRSSITTDSYLVGDGTAFIKLRTPSGVLANIDATPRTPIDVANWNNATEPGFYQSHQASNSPPSGETWQGWVTNRSGGPGQVTQLLSRVTTADNIELWMRIRIHNSSSWSAWKQVYGDTGWVNCSVSSGTGTIRARILNGVVHLAGQLIDAASISASLPAGIPSPPTVVAKTIAIGTSGNTTQFNRITVSAGGGISGNRWTTGSGGPGVSTPYYFDGLNWPAN